jgi:hypothetical protein
MCILDLAGVENKFDCDKIDNFNKSYNSSESKYSTQPIELENIEKQFDQNSTIYSRNQIIDEEKLKILIDNYNQIKKEIMLGIDSNIRFGKRNVMINHSQSNNQFDFTLKSCINIKDLEHNFFQNKQKIKKNDIIEQFNLINYLKYDLDLFKILKNSSIFINEQIVASQLSKITFGEKTVGLVVKNWFDSTDQNRDEIFKDGFDLYNLLNELGIKVSGTTDTGIKLNPSNNKIAINYELEQNRLINEATQQLDILLCMYYRLQKISFNCLLRQIEGNMINSLLYGIRIDIKKLIKSSLVISNHDASSKELMNTLPIAIDNNIYPYCKDLEMDITESYQDFYNLDKIKEPEFNIMMKLKEKGLNLSSANFIILTVINLTGDTVNNPPNPPYININSLLHAKIKNDPDNMKIELHKLINKIIKKKYNFYKDFKIYDGNKYITLDDIITNKEYNNEISINDLAIKFIDFITRTNAITLIGTLESTDQIQNYTYDKNICIVNSDEEKIFKLYNQDKKDKSAPYIPLSTNIDPLAQAYNKYLKYKNKYLRLKEKIRNHQ